MALATICVDIAPIYQSPSLDSTRQDEGLYGMSVQVIQESEKGWCYIRTEYQSEGYMPTACLVTAQDFAAAWRKYKKMVVLAPYIDVQKQPTAESQRLVSLTRGGILVELAPPQMDGWQKVGLVDGGVGYTRASYMGEVITNWKAISEEDMRWNLVETALSYNGAAWRSGGRSPMGIDSAGLMAISYHINGITIPRKKEFIPGGLLRPINQKQLSEGDILFFSGSVGMYMGDNRFVHATELMGGEGVVVSSMRPKDEDYRGDLASNIVAMASVF